MHKILTDTSYTPAVYDRSLLLGFPIALSLAIKQCVSPIIAASDPKYPHMSQRKPGVITSASIERISKSTLARLFQVQRRNRGFFCALSRVVVPSLLTQVSECTFTGPSFAPQTRRRFLFFLDHAGDSAMGSLVFCNSTVGRRRLRCLTTTDGGFSITSPALHAKTPLSFAA